MPRRDTRDKGAKKSPRRAGPPKKSAKKPEKITRSVAARNAKRAARSETGRRKFQLRGPLSTSLMKAYGLLPSGYELLPYDPKIKRFVQMNGDAEEGVPAGTRCYCLTLGRSSCRPRSRRVIGRARWPL